MDTDPLMLLLSIPMALAATAVARVVMVVIGLARMPELPPGAYFPPARVVSSRGSRKGQRCASMRRMIALSMSLPCARRYYTVRPMMVQPIPGKLPATKPKPKDPPDDDPPHDPPPPPPHPPPPPPPP